MITILNDIQINEATLNAEGNAPIKAMQESLHDGYLLHQNRLDKREVDVQRILATRNIYPKTVLVLEDIMTAFDKVTRKEELYCNAMLSFIDNKQA